MRKLASVQRILDIQPIEGADKIVKAQIGGWWVVTAIDNGFKVDDKVVYCEIDSWLPHELAPFLSRGNEPRVFNGVSGERLRTIKLRGQISQGMILPLSVLDTNSYNISDGELSASDFNWEEGFDVTEILAIQKWEMPVNAQLQGRCRSTFPSHIIPKTDQERCQNITREIQDAYDNNDLFEATRKLDGSSITVYRYATYDAIEDNHELTIGVCSRNMDLELDQEGNSFVDTAKSSGLLKAIEALALNIAVQGELVGEGIQGNPEKLHGHAIYVFDIYDIDAQRYLTPEERGQMMYELELNGATGLNHVDIVSYNKPLPTKDISELLKLSEGKNAVGVEQEGLVYKRMDGKFSFKAISNNFLLKGGD